MFTQKTRSDELSDKFFNKLNTSKKSKREGSALNNSERSTEEIE
jgi:hypothetical protein